MSKEYPTRAGGPPGRPTLPPDAEAEIMERLSANMRISSEEIAAIQIGRASCRERVSASV